MSRLVCDLAFGSSWSGRRHCLSQSQLLFLISWRKDAFSPPRDASLGVGGRDPHGAVGSASLETGFFYELCCFGSFYIWERAKLCLGKLTFVFELVLSWFVVFEMSFESLFVHQKLFLRDYIVICLNCNCI